MMAVTTDEHEAGTVEPAVVEPAVLEPADIEPADIEPAVLEPGHQINDDYRVVGHMRRGVDLDVYDVWSERRWCRCVIKTARPDTRHSEPLRRRLGREGDLACRLAHPHLVRGYETITEPELMVVLETITGVTLGYLLECVRARLPLVDLANLGEQVGSAIRYLHHAGYIHLDLKPSNIISESGKAKVIDLSLVRPPGPGPIAVGTRIYMAPEQARDGMLTEACDVWGLGLVLYEAATGVQPFDDGRDAPSADKGTVGAVDDHYPQLEVSPVPIKRLRRLPIEMAMMIDACLDRDPTGRPSIEDVAATCARFG